MWKLEKFFWETKARDNCNPLSRLEMRPLKSLISNVRNFKSWIKLSYDIADVCNLVMNESNPTFEVQNMGN